MNTNQRSTDVLPRLAAYKAANATDIAYYRRVIKEAPERALDMLLYKDMQRHEAEMRQVDEQFPGVKEYYDQQTTEIKRRIDQRLTEIHPYFWKKAFVGEVIREKNRLSRQT